VRFVDCFYLRGIPGGPPISEDAGPPPQPQSIVKTVEVCVQ